MNHIRKFTQFNESWWDKVKSGATELWNKASASLSEPNDYVKMIEKEESNFTKFDLKIEHNFESDETEQWVRVFHNSAGVKIISQQSVYDALMNRTKFKKIYIDKNIDRNQNPMIQDIDDEAKNLNIPIELVDKSKLSSMTKNDHEGVIGIIGAGKRLIALIKHISDQLTVMVFLYETENPSSKKGGGGGIKWNKNLSNAEEAIINSQSEKPYGRTPMKDVVDSPGGLQSLLQSVYRFWYLKTRSGKAKKKNAYPTGI
jgi:hypothetical protein